MPRSLTKKKKDQLTSRIKAWTLQQHNNTFNYKQVAHAIAASTPIEQHTVSSILEDMALTRDLIEVSPGKYKTPQNTTTSTTGTFIRRSNGQNSVITDTDGETINIAERNSLHALNGDKVRINIAAHRRGVEPEAQVIEIIQKNDQTFIGTLHIEHNIALLLTDSKHLATDIIIPQNRLKGGQTGDKAVVRITHWNDNAKNPRGEVIDILGRQGDNNTEMHAILAEYGLPYTYPTKVDQAAQHIQAGITPDVIASRLDMRHVTTFTIDPADAKDFDDALSLRTLPNGNHEVGIHIADVTHYVTPGTIIDREAAHRATSVYLVDRVVPMLPEHLSNGICSLRPDEDKLTFSCIFELDDNAHIISHKIVRTVIRSNRRYTYDEVQHIITTGTGDYSTHLITLNNLAHKLRQQRYQHGSVDFDRVEVKFDIDSNGHPTAIHFKESMDANKLIEEFMLLANKTVAQTIGSPATKTKPKAFVYRIHDLPDDTKLRDLSTIASTFGHKVKTTGSAEQINQSINKMLTDIKGQPEQHLLSTLAVRAMSKATYSTDNIGHYGLGFQYYTHFTSPIRRYPDMLVHRLLDRYLNGGRSANVIKLEDECKHSSSMEQLAASAERASIKYKQVEYMTDKIGLTYTGVITGVTEWGLYVELDENMCEGLIPIRDLADDYYDLDERNYCLKGRHTNTRYQLGDKVTIRVAQADLYKKRLDFTLATHTPPAHDPHTDHMGPIVTATQALSRQPRKKHHNPRKTSRRPRR